MGLVVPMILFFLLQLDSLKLLFGMSAVLFFGWAVTDFMTTLLSRPRLSDRSPTDAIREWDRQRSD